MKEVTFLAKYERKNFFYSFDKFSFHLIYASDFENAYHEANRLLSRSKKYEKIVSLRQKIN